VGRVTTRLVLLLVAFGVILGCAIGVGELLKLAERPDGSTALDSSITNWVVAHRVSGLTTLARVQALRAPDAPADGYLADERR
jgi:hypothetical protein